ncbi:MAG TPA: hypothetical protein VGD14_09575 [bacterium]
MMKISDRIFRLANSEIIPDPEGEGSIYRMLFTASYKGGTKAMYCAMRCDFKCITKNKTSLKEFIKSVEQGIINGAKRLYGIEQNSISYHDKSSIKKFLLSPCPAGRNKKQN